MKGKRGCIYKITNKVSGKSYIGQTINYKARMSRHFSRDANSPYLANSIKKHGKDTFTSEIIESGIHISLLSQKEIYWIAFYDTISPNGYNLTEGGESASPSIETRRKMSESTKGKKNPNYGKSRSTETRRKISESTRGKPKRNRMHKKSSSLQLKFL